MSNSAKPAKQTRFSAIISALALAAVTLGTFGVLREVGPESTLRKFHRAAANRDLRQAVALSVHSSAEDVTALASFVARIAARGGQFQIGGNLRKGNNLVIVEATYYLPNAPGGQPISWIIEREDSRSPWRVNASLTLQILRQPFQNLN